MLPLLHPANSSESVVAALQKIIDEATAPFPGQFLSSITPTTYDDFWGWFQKSNGPLWGGFDGGLVSRLLDGKALADREGLKRGFKTLTKNSNSVSVYLVGGKNVMNAKPRGKSNAINPAWRKAYVHSRKCLGKENDM